MGGHEAKDCRVVSKCLRCNGIGHLARDCPQKPPPPTCLRCKGVGHLARNCPLPPTDGGHIAGDCPQKTPSKVSTGAMKNAPNSSKKHVKEGDDAISVRSNSTTATQSDLRCSFCGAVRAVAKSKYRTNTCKDRCQSCFRKFD